MVSAITDRPLNPARSTRLNQIPSYSSTEHSWVAFSPFLGLSEALLSKTLTKDRELDAKVLEVGLGVLWENSAKSQLAAARGWAVHVINDGTRVTMNPKVKKERLK